MHNRQPLIFTEPHRVYVNEQFQKDNKAPTKFKGRYKLQVRNAQTHQLVREREFDNLILNAGLERYGVNGAGIIGYAHIGTGTTAPDVGQTTLAAKVAHTNTTSTGHGTTGNYGVAENYRGYYTWVYRFAAGVLNGNYTEVGVGWDTTNLYSRALILDGGGTPTSLTVLSNEYLDIVYVLEMEVLNTDTVFNDVNIDGNLYTVTMRPAYIANTRPFGSTIYAVSTVSSAMYNYSGAIGDITGQPSGTVLPSAEGAWTHDAYVSNSKERVTHSYFPLGNGNQAGGSFPSLRIATTATGNQAVSWQFGFSPNVPKDNTMILTLDFRISWDRV